MRRRHALHALLEALQMVRCRPQLNLGREPMEVAGAAEQHIVLGEVFERLDEVARAAAEGCVGGFELRVGCAARCE